MHQDGFNKYCLHSGEFGETQAYIFFLDEYSSSLYIKEVLGQHVSNSRATRCHIYTLQVKYPLMPETAVGLALEMARCVI